MSHIFFKIKYYWLVPFILIMQYLLVPHHLLGAKPVDQNYFGKELAKVDLDKKTYKLVPRNKSEKKEKKEKNKIEGLENPFSSKAFQLMAYLICFALFCIIVYAIFKNVEIVKNSKVRAEDVDLEDIEDINKIDLQKLYVNALSNEDYRLALRIKFLMIIQKLTLDNIVQWKKEKTNRIYINEILDDTIRTDFRKIVSIYERVWYGNTKLTKEIFHIVNSDFDTFNGKI
jgi:hypothetical protein